MQGVPGSGKSTLAEMVATYWEANLVPTTTRSTDDYRYGECGHYVHDPAANAALHRRTQQEVAEDMRNGVPVVIVDNTNIARWQAEPYIVLAKIYDYEVNVLRADPGLDTAKTRNATRPIERRVPDHVIEDMYSRMENLL